MKVIRGVNVNEVFQIAVMSLREDQALLETDSRNGPVLSFPTPLTTIYERPDERVLFSAERNCNPFFHFIEGLWMIAGRQDLKTLTMFAKKMADFSDDGVLVNGAYGYRWTEWFGRDQLSTVIDLLRKNPLDRRAVLQMWDCTQDLGSSSKDVPCNTQVFLRGRPTSHWGEYFGDKTRSPQERQNKYYLDMTVTNRSNDLIWGMYGANAVHFSMVHEYLASCMGMGLGRYYQVSSNPHVYLDVWRPLDEKLPQGIHPDPYEAYGLQPVPLVDKWEEFDVEVCLFFDWLHSGESHVGYQNQIFPKTAIPMVEAWWLWKEQMINEAIDKAREIEAPDWRKACVEWLERKK